MNNTEEWREIKGYEVLYEVSNMGNIRSVGRYVNGKNKSKCFKKSINRKLQISHKGYLTIILQNNGNKKQFQVHRLVGGAFISNPRNKPQINHIDCDKKNNSVDNLEWVTQQENMNHAKDNNLFKGATEKQRKAALKNVKKAQQSRLKSVKQFTINGEFIKEYKSIADAERETKTNNSKITQCCKGNRNQSNNFKWEYANILNIKEMAI